MTRPRRASADRVVTLAALREALACERGRGRTVVFTNGCFDLLHPGHVELLEQAGRLGDVLVVALNDDASVRRLKGADRPFQPFEVRARVVAAVEPVDWVVGFAEDTPAELVASVQPDVLVKGGDWAPDAVVGRDTVEARGGRVVTVPVVPGHSTTDTVERIRRRRPNDP